MDEHIKKARFRGCKVCQSDLDMSLECHTSVHLKCQRSPGQDNVHPKDGKKVKHSLATFKPQISYLLSTAKNTNKNLVSSSAGMFSQGVGLHVMIHWLPSVCLVFLMLLSAGEE